ncbi:ROK family protein [Gemmatirosa kalamazoonensis]|uniref:ROK family protein n=1 Tax=Gemmatirosa kalamazoonensis TaxID=861299 RepID=W0RFY4_9BACT|nr:ROK family transcriptional regulator [Gemmatirosa kalamazoonensis]AHG89347.1 ROK family protein [Gemmatirosa kalamazoonensis]
MRKINTRNFHRASRSTSREVNRQIVLNLIREQQPISRADLARRMEVARSALTLIVRELVASGSIYESVDDSGTHGLGRRPTLLRVRTNAQLAIAVDVRSTDTTIALADFSGQVLARDTFATPDTPEALIDELAERIPVLHPPPAGGLGAGHGERRGVAIVVPGMVDGRTGRVLYAPRLRWRDVDLCAPLSRRLGLPVYLENAPIACALARLWLAPEETAAVRNFAYVSISEGVGVGLVANGEALRGEAHTAGEFGHVLLDPHGPTCVCGKRGCWESFTCNAMTVERYVERVMHRRARRAAGERWSDATLSADAYARPTTVEEIVGRAGRGEEEAIWALAETGWYIGRGLASVVSAFNPGRIYVGGEITAGWAFIEGPLRQALTEGTLTEAARLTPVLPDRRPAEYRLLGAVALVAAPTFAAPPVA